MTTRVQFTIIRFSVIALVGLILLLPLTAISKDKTSTSQDSAFGAGWELVPLKNPEVTQKPEEKEAKRIASSAMSHKPFKSPLSDPNTLLKPAAKFIAQVESKLNLEPETEQVLTERLNRIQIILYGEKKYDDAGLLLQELAKTFPESATVARREIVKNMMSLHPEGKATKQSKRKRSVEKSSTTKSEQIKQNLYLAKTQPAQPKYNNDRTQWHSWDEDFETEWNGFGNATEREKEQFRKTQQEAWEKAYKTEQKRAEKGERFRSIKNGLMNLAMIAAPVAGQYYLNKNAQATNRYSQPGQAYSAYNNPYYLQPNRYYINPNQYSPYGQLAPVTSLQRSNTNYTYPQTIYSQNPYSQYSYSQYPGYSAPVASQYGYYNNGYNGW